MKEVSYPSVDRIVADAPPTMTRFKVEVDEDIGVGLVTINRPERSYQKDGAGRAERDRVDG